MRKKFIAIVLAMVTVFATGCNMKKKNKSESNEYTLEIEIFNAGYGITWAEELGKKFTEANPEYKVNVMPSRNFDMAESILKSGPKNNTADILIYQYPYYMQHVSEKLSDGSAILADLSDVYNGVADGETKTVKERISPSMENIFNYNGTGKYYAFPTLNDTNGLVYNVNLFERNGWDVPLTTDELAELADTINRGGTGVKPFAWVAGYWEYCTSAWWAQYEGLQNYEKFYRPDYDVAPSDPNSGYAQKGREESLRVLETLINPTSRYSIDGCLSLEFSEIQAAFVKQDKAAMMPNGGWMINEMKDDSYGEKFAMMKLPVISALGVKLGIRDRDLKGIIQYIDGGETGNKPEFTSTKGLSSEEVISAVREARCLNSSSIAYTNVALVPAYSDAVDLAKKFLLYTTTSDAMKMTFENSGMMPLVYSEIANIDATNLSRFDKSKIELAKAANNKMVSMEMCSDPVFYMNGLRAYTFAENIFPEKVLAAASSKDRKTASKIIEEEITYIGGSWNHFCNNAKGVLGK